MDKKMKKNPSSRILAALLAVLVFSGWGPGKETALREDFTFFTTSARLDESGTHWIVPVHGVVYLRKVKGPVRKGLLWLGQRFARSERKDDLEDAEEIRLGKKKQTDEDDLESREGIADPELARARGMRFLLEGEEGRYFFLNLAGKNYSLGPTDKKGHARKEIKIPRETAEALAKDGVLTFTGGLSTKENRIEGRVLLVPETGLSVISDIDDTIKESEVYDREELVENTLFYPFRPVEYMARLYKEWEDCGAAFHYVSLSPWQLFVPLDQFLTEAGFPLGSVHLRYMKPLGFGLLFGREKHSKIEIIEEILKKYPERRFVLVGDSTQKDAEVYAGIVKKYPEQVEHVYIRYVFKGVNTEEGLKEILTEIPPEKRTIFPENKAKELAAAGCPLE